MKLLRESLVASLKFVGLEFQVCIAGQHEAAGGGVHQEHLSQDQVFQASSYFGKNPFSSLFTLQPFPVRLGEKAADFELLQKIRTLLCSE